MHIDNTKLKEILVKENYLTEEDIEKSIEASKEAGLTLGDYLISSHFISKNLLGQALAESYGVPYLDLNGQELPKKQIQEIPEGVARKNKLILFKKEKKEVFVATSNPVKKGLKDRVKKIFPKHKVVLGYSLEENIEKNFIAYRKSLDTRFSKIISSKSRIAPEILQEIFKDSYDFHASDIHFEPMTEDTRVRFRIDGVLQEAGRIPKEYYENILNRIKVLSSLRIDEHFTSQDGSMRFEFEVDKEKHYFDLRTSIVPTVKGEKVVLRLLSAYVEGFDLSDLGLGVKSEEILREAAKKPFGMILVTGPTGSGKTTTLYGVLKFLNQPDVNITTIEDPVEYKIEGINQIQTNTDTDLTFAKGLRSIVRQDPDVILVGEIRDEETAEIAVNAALTGHLMLSTFHANDAATSIPRLLDMSVEPFLLSSTLELVIAQRLVRRICNVCRYSVSINRDDLKDKMEKPERFFDKKEINMYKGKGCDSCGNTGYKGRTAIFEFLPITPRMEELILKSPSTIEIWKLAHKEGAESLFENGLSKVKSGITTLEELLRVAPPPKD